MDSTELSSPEALAEFWKNRYQKQRLLIAAITSLMAKYGSTTDVAKLHSTFVLTLMGHYGVGDAAYYTALETDGLSPVVAYGRVPITALPKISLDSQLIRHLDAHRPPSRVSAIPSAAIESSQTEIVAKSYRVVSPLFLKDRLVGVLFLGDKVTGQSFRDFDFDVMEAVCAVSATTFNNATLYRNAKLSADEVRRLFDIRTEVVDRITHEFRTPLTIIKGGIEPFKDDENLGAIHESVSQAIERLEGLINDLLAFSTKHVDTGDGSAVALDPVTTIQEAITRCTKSARAKDIRISLVNRLGIDSVTVSVSDSELGTVFDALLDNAIKFSGTSTCVEVLVGTTDDPRDVAAYGNQLPDWKEHTAALVDEYTPKNGESRSPRSAPSPSNVDRYCVISVIDEGIGIPDDEIMSVAEPFRQASNSPNHGVKGTGIGLALAQKIVTQHGGTVLMMSEEGQGTTVTVALPCHALD